jgi:hypothetical protein
MSCHSGGATTWFAPLDWGPLLPVPDPRSEISAQALELCNMRLMPRKACRVRSSFSISEKRT